MSRSVTAPTEIVFELDASAAQGSLFVQFNGDDDQPGWVSVRNDAGRVHLRPRCDVATCGEASAVCGAAIPLVRNLGTGGTTRRIETTWDKRASVVDTVARCQHRLPAVGGEYVARFCYARSAATEEPFGSEAIGRLVDPVCVERRFTLGDARVVVRVP